MTNGTGGSAPLPRLVEKGQDTSGNFYAMREDHAGFFIDYYDETTGEHVENTGPHATVESCREEVRAHG